MEFGVWSLEFGVWGLGSGVWGLGFGVWNFERTQIMQMAAEEDGGHVFAVEEEGAQGGTAVT